MNSYFDYIVSKLDLNELKILGILYDNNAITTYKAMLKKNVIEESGLTEAKFRKSLTKLEANCFVEIVTGSKSHKIYLTDYGVSALSKSLEGEDV